jgi:transposase
MAEDQRSRGFAAKEQKLQNKLDNLQSRYDGARKLLEEPGGKDTSRMKGANKLLSQIDEVKQQLKDLRGYVVPPTPKNRPASKYRGEVKPAPGSKLKDKGGANSKFQNKEASSRIVEKIVGSDSSRPLIVDTKSKKPIAKRIMEALGDERTMEQATKDREMNKRMERETMGRKKGGMGQKKKSTVKKAYGGMVKKKHGGSANKVNMKAGFTRRGCAKG